MGTIHLEGMEFFAYHGCFHEEQIIGTHFTVDLMLSFDTTEAEKTDLLAQTINYQEVYGIVRHEMEQKSHLIEHVARRIMEAVKRRYSTVNQVEIRLAKKNPTLGGKVQQVAITLQD